MLTIYIYIYICIYIYIYIYICILDFGGEGVEALTQRRDLLVGSEGLLPGRLQAPLENLELRAGELRAGLDRGHDESPRLFEVIRGFDDLLVGRRPSRLFVRDGRDLYMSVRVSHRIGCPISV